MNISQYNGVIPWNIRRIIGEKGLKQGYIAKKANLSEQQLCDIVNNRRIVKASEVAAISNALGVGVPELYKCQQEVL